MRNRTKSDASADSPAVPRIVGLGASAGGLDALGQFLKAVPEHSGCAFIVVQHLDPTQKAMLSQLLQRITPMAVCEAEERMHIQPDCVYVIPPNRALTVVRGELHLAAPEQPRGLRLPIDGLFTSLANDQREHAIGVVLSGMGSDGKLGLQAIKASGGLTMAQKPESAEFDSMPRSAIDAGCVDFVGTPTELAAHVLTTAASPPPPMPGSSIVVPAEQTPDTATAKALQDIIQLLAERGKHDFSLYKHSTLLRRIERRMGLHRMATMADYASMLRNNPQELDLLFKELLIGVTGFFRDPAVWQLMRDEVFPKLIEEQNEGANLRAWVVGCSTGEEAYSMAMVFREAASAMPQHAACNLQIFATDLSLDAITTARSGRYPASISGEVSPERMTRFFTADENGYRVSKNIREMVVFAPHDLIRDPPFTKLDLLACRNLMIYFTAPLQKRLLPLFHYSLRPGGILLLGTSETVGRFDHLFEPLDSKSRLYRRRDAIPQVAAPEFPVKVITHTPTAPKKEPSVSDVHSDAIQPLADHVLLQEFSPSAVLVNEQGDILYINGRTGKYLEPAAGKANWNVHVMAQESLRPLLASALRQASSTKETVTLHGLKLDGGKPGNAVDITVRPLHEPKALDGMLMIVFRDVALPVPAGSKRRSKSSVHQELEAELQRAREEAQALREEMRASQEELQASNEELQSTNEELQSTNEELTSSKEEMQSMNEELHAVNVELQSKLDDLALAQSDMTNLLNSTNIATLFLDKELNVRRYTRQATKIINLRESDVGRPLSDLTSSLDYPDLQKDAGDMLHTLKILEKEIPCRDGRWFAVRIMPYRNQDEVVQGAVITFVEITAAKKLEAQLRSA